MEWARTLRIDAPPSEALRSRVAQALARDGVAVRFGEAQYERTYALVEGPQGVDPAELDARVPDARWYGEAIIALAIEPVPADALPLLTRALAGPGAPAGVCGCETREGRIIVEFRPLATQPALVLQVVDAELRRFRGHRRTQSLAPLPLEVVTRIAADGLQSPEITADRVLESLLGLTHVE